MTPRIWVVYILATLLGLFAAAEKFTEELTITRTLSDNQLAQFKFVTESDSLELGPDYGLFPRIIGEMVNKYQLWELSLTLTQGVWRSEAYGLPPQPSSTTGAEIHAWINSNGTDVDEKWSYMINSLNGAFCTSLVDVYPSLTYEPEEMFKPRGLKVPSSDYQVRAAHLARETVCTENLTPWRKLLPCKQHGLVTLLNPLKLYAAAYHSLGLQLYPVEETDRQFFRLELFVTVLFDIPLQSRRLDWSLDTLFQRDLAGQCAVADESRLIVVKDEGIELTPQPDNVYKTGKREWAVYETQTLLDGKASADIQAIYPNKVLDMNNVRNKGEISISSTLGGTDQFSGRLLTVIRNFSPNDRKIVYSQVLPWWLRVYYHTISLKCKHENGKERRYLGYIYSLLITYIKKDTHNRMDTLRRTCFTTARTDKATVTVLKRDWSPAIARKRPALLEVQMEVEKNTGCSIQVEFEKAFLRMAEYPPDANHGLYIPGALLKVHGIESTVPGSYQTTSFETISRNSTTKSPHFILLHSNVLLVPLPVPDFSMPFNVICFVATGISLCFGPVHSFSTKMLLPVNCEIPRPPFIRRMIRFILLILLVLASYAHYHDMGVNEIKRAIEKQLEKLNSM